MMNFAGPDTEIADILLVNVTDAGEIRVNVGEGSTNFGFGSSVELWGNGDGFISCPNNPDGNGYAQAIVAQEGHVKRVWATRDARYISKVGALKPGDRAIVSNCDARLMLKTERNGITLYTVNAQDDDHSMMVDLAGQDGILTVLNSGAVIRIEKDKIVLAVDGGGSIVIDKGGVTINGKAVTVASGQVSLGVLPGGLPPVPGVNSAVIGPGGPAGVPSKTVMIAP